MKKISLIYSILICLIISTSVQGQSKKKQIELLNGKLDSLNEVVSNERNNYIQAVQLKDSLISSQKEQLNQLIQRNVSLNTQLDELEGDKVTLIQEQSSLERRIDSLNQEIAELGITIPEDAITVYGIIKYEIMYHGDHYYEVKILEGSLTNVSELWLHSGLGKDINAVHCICPPFNDPDLEGEKFIAIVKKSECMSENMEYGGIDTMPCYRPIFLKRL